MEGKIIKKNMKQFMNHYKMNPNNVYIVTGRGNEPELIQRLFKERWNIELPVENIITVANRNSFDNVLRVISERFGNNPFQHDNSPLGSIHKKKKMALFSIILRGYDKIYFWDDDKDNIDEAEELKSDLERIPQFRNIQIENYWINENVENER